MQELRLSPEETTQYLAIAERVDGFAAGARALAEHMKQAKLQEIMAARKAAPAPNPQPTTEPKE